MVVVRRYGFAPGGRAEQGEGGGPGPAEAGWGECGRAGPAEREGAPVPPAAAPGQ